MRLPIKLNVLNLFLSQVRPPSVNSNNSNQPGRPGDFRRGGFSKTPSREGSLAGSDRPGSQTGRPGRYSLDNRFLSGPQQEVGGIFFGVGAWCHVNRIIINFSEASIPPRVCSSIHP